MRTFRQRGYFTRKGRDRLNHVLAESAELYNAELKCWRRQFEESGRSDSLFERMKAFTATRNASAFWQNLSVYVGRGVLCRADRAKQNHYRRVKNGEKPGFPRYKSRNRFRTIELDQAEPAMIKPDRNGYRVMIKGLPVIRLRTKRKLPATEGLKSIRITFKGRRVSVSLVYKVEIKPLPRNASRVGLDMGVISRITTSDGQRIERRSPDRAEIARKQRRMSACKRGSRRFRDRRRILANAHSRAKIRNVGQCHQITTNLVHCHGFIALEDLAVRKMSRSGGARKTGLNRSIYEQSWRRIREQLVYKAESAGRKLVFVDPRNTSQLCSGCGARVKKSLEQRTHRCDCGLVLDRDHNAAINILNRALGGGILPPAVGETA